MNLHFSTTHNNWDPNIVVPLVVAKFHDENIYVDPIWGIKIEKVMADGKLIPPSRYDVVFDDVNFSQLRIGDSYFIYRVLFRDFYFAKSFTRQSWELEKYILPPDARLIHIEYHLRESDERLGPLLTLESHFL